MKNLLLICFLFFALIASAQVPFKFNYQTVVRDANGNLITTGAVILRMKIFDAQTNGTLLYMEEHPAYTPNAQGLISLQIGAGTVSVGTNLSSLDWGNGTKWIETEMSVNGSGFSVVGTRSQLVSVPYAIKAGSADIKYVTTGEITTTITHNQTNTLLDAGQELTVPENGTYLILCDAIVQWDQTPNIIAEWVYQIFNSTTNQSLKMAVGELEYNYNGSFGIVGDGKQNSSTHTIAQLSKNDVIKVRYGANSASGNPSTATWRVLGCCRSLSLVKLAD